MDNDPANPYPIQLDRREVKHIERIMVSGAKVETDIMHIMLEAGVWQLGDFTFASGKAANNKFDMDRLALPENRGKLISTLFHVAVLVNRYDFDAVWGVPTGGQELLARPISEVFSTIGKVINVIELEKDIDQPGLKTYAYRTARDFEIAMNAKNMLGFEDVTTELTSVAGALQLPELLFATKAVIVGIRRGDPEHERRINVPVEAAFTEQVPNVITPDHPFYQIYGHLAQGNLSG